MKATLKGWKVTKDAIEAVLVIPNNSENRHGLASMFIDEPVDFDTQQGELAFGDNQS